MLQLVVGGALVAGAVALAWRNRGGMRRYAERHGWRYIERDDELARTWTMPPFADLRTPGDIDLVPRVRRLRVQQAAHLRVAGSAAISFALTEIIGEGVDPVTNTFHVVTLNTDQGLPRSMVRGGIDVYVLPAYEGLHRIRQPTIWLRRGMLSVLAEDPQVLDQIPFTAITDELGIDHALTVVTDGDWIYAYRPGGARPWRIEQTVLLLQRLARAIPGRPWPGPQDPGSNVYGAV